MKWNLVLTAAVLAACVSVVFPPEGKAQNSAKQGTLDKIKVQGNLEEIRRTAMFSFTFRPATLRSPNRRYPVVYFLHGYAALRPGGCR